MPATWTTKRAGKAGTRKRRLQQRQPDSAMGWRSTEVATSATPRRVGSSCSTVTEPKKSAASTRPPQQLSDVTTARPKVCAHASCRSVTRRSGDAAAPRPPPPPPASASLPLLPSPRQAKPKPKPKQQAGASTHLLQGGAFARMGPLGRSEGMDFKPTVPAEAEAGAEAGPGSGQSASAESCAASVSWDRTCSVPLAGRLRPATARSVPLCAASVRGSVGSVRPAASKLNATLLMAASSASGHRGGAAGGPDAAAAMLAAGTASTCALGRGRTRHQGWGAAEIPAVQRFEGRRHLRVRIHGDPRLTGAAGARGGGGGSSGGGGGRGGGGQTRGGDGPVLRRARKEGGSLVPAPAPAAPCPLDDVPAADPEAAGAAGGSLPRPEPDAPPAAPGGGGATDSSSARLSKRSPTTPDPAVRIHTTSSGGSSASRAEDGGRKHMRRTPYRGVSATSTAVHISSGASAPGSTTCSVSTCSTPMCAATTTTPRAPPAAAAAVLFSGATPLLQTPCRRFGSRPARRGGSSSGRQATSASVSRRPGAAGSAAAAAPGCAEGSWASRRKSAQRSSAVKASTASGLRGPKSCSDPGTVSMCSTRSSRWNSCCTSSVPSDGSHSCRQSPQLTSSWRGRGASCRSPAGGKSSSTRFTKQPVMAVCTAVAGCSCATMSPLLADIVVANTVLEPVVVDMACPNSLTSTW
ncbi:hypothetical protein TSOC_009665 [Tetrabaena socialis]|uniref:Uncharacterized protein n=1 Tax=Tetrabaena socialis TaxID=47790 RepID=A0A2J7ZVA2_9CHLO|nr:hypothetical protein TSOC_009665 [Tetrabaena socialis]|eukprot:PNH04203.1 hypothetical protein TSOC_009665 [Tetrabaena socialis]